MKEINLKFPIEGKNDIYFPSPEDIRLLIASHNHSLKNYGHGYKKGFLISLSLIGSVTQT
jgi:hypothetical protein